MGGVCSSSVTTVGDDATARRLARTALRARKDAAVRRARDMADYIVSLQQSAELYAENGEASTFGYTSLAGLAEGLQPFEFDAICSAFSGCTVTLHDQGGTDEHVSIDWTAAIAAATAKPGKATAAAPVPVSGNGDACGADADVADASTENEHERPEISPLLRHRRGSKHGCCT